MYIRTERKAYFVLSKKRMGDDDPEICMRRLETGPFRISL